MSKKRKLNSKNPKYWPQEMKEGPKIKKKILMCTTQNNVKVYGVWYKN